MSAWRRVRHVAVRPQRVASGRRARVVEQARLRHEHERPLRNPTFPGDALGRRDLGERAAEVDGGRVRHRAVAPRHRTVEREVDLVGAHAVAVSLELTAIAVRQRPAGDAQERPRREVAEDGARRRQILDRIDPRVGDDLAAKRAQVAAERIGEPLRAAARNRPAVRVRDGGEHQADRAGRQRIERQHAVRGIAGEQRPRPLRSKAPLRQPLGRLQRGQAEAGRGERVRWQPRRPEDDVGQPRPVANHRPDQAAIGAFVGARARRPSRQRARDDRRRRRRRRDAPASPAAESIRGRARQAAATGRTATPRPSDRPTNRRRARSRGASAARIGTRRRSSARLRRRRRCVPPARGRSPRRGRWGRRRRRSHLERPRL